MKEKFISQDSIGPRPEADNDELNSMAGEIQEMEPGDRAAQERFRSLGFELGDEVQVREKKSNGEIIYIGKITQFAGVPEYSENPPTLIVHISSPDDTSRYIITSYKGSLSGPWHQEVEIEHRSS
jgi:hypothetical protein